VFQRMSSEVEDKVEQRDRKAQAKIKAESKAD
jgi:hypothetical protein